MAQQYSTALRNGMLAAWESIIGASPTLEIRSGGQPANCAAADSGTLLASLALPSDWLEDPANGVLAKKGTWSDSSADGTGSAAHYRIKSSGGTVHEQGSVTATGGGGDLTVDNVSVASGQAFSITSFSKTAPGA